MKKFGLALAGVAVFALGCQPPPAGGSKELTERIEKLEKKVEALEKRPAGKRGKRQPPPPQKEAYKIPIDTSRDATMGAKEAPVTVTVFSDFQCPFCARVDPMLQQVVKDPELKGKVNVVFKHFPLSFHKQARPAAKAALAAKEQGDEYFWKMGEKMLANQRALGDENFSKWAEEIGLDVKKFEQDLKNNDAKYEKQISEDMKQGTTVAKVRGTPSLFVNGWELRQRSVDGVKSLIKEKDMM